VSIFGGFKRLVFFALLGCLAPCVVYAAGEHSPKESTEMQVQMDPATQEMIWKQSISPDEASKVFRKQLATRELLPPLSGNSFEKRACETKVTFRAKAPEKGKEPIIELDVQGDVVAGFSGAFGDMVSRSSPTKPIQIKPQAFLWCNGATHVFANSVSVAKFLFEPAADSTLKFRVDQEKGYVFAGGKGKVKPPKGEVIDLDESQVGFVLGKPAGKKK
jgi:hypothetical protein